MIHLKRCSSSDRKVEWTFSVKNYDGNIVSETAMDLAFTVDIAASTGKEAIAPLIVTIKKGDTVVGTKTGTGSIIFADEFALNEVGQAHTYTVIIDWPSDDTIDINYAGSGFGTAISVSVTGTVQALVITQNKYIFKRMCFFINSLFLKFMI